MFLVMSKDENEEFKRAIDDNLSQFSQPYICPICRKKDCRNPIHILKLLTVPRSALKPKHYFLVFIFLMLLWFLAVGAYYLYSYLHE